MGTMYLACNEHSSLDLVIFKVTSAAGLKVTGLTSGYLYRYLMALQWSSYHYCRLSCQRGATNI